MSKPPLNYSRLPTYISRVRAARVKDIDFVYGVGNYVFKSARITLEGPDEKILGILEVDREYLNKNMPVLVGGYYICTTEGEEFWLPGHVFGERYELDEPI